MTPRAARRASTAQRGCAKLGGEEFLPNFVLTGYDDIDFLAENGLSEADLDKIGVDAALSRALPETARDVEPHQPTRRAADEEEEDEEEEGEDGDWRLGGERGGRRGSSTWGGLAVSGGYIFAHRGFYPSARSSGAR